MKPARAGWLYVRRHNNCAPLQMTLVIACLTPDVVYQVSDRRLTLLSPPWTPIDDEANKAVFVDGRMAFSYAGLGQIGMVASDERTDRWLARVAGTVPADDLAAVAEQIRSEATQAFASLKCPPEVKRHAFQGAGWLRLKGETFFTPGIITIHNAIDPQTGAWTAKAKPEFAVSTVLPTRFPAGCVVASVGKPISVAEKSEVVRLLRKCLKHPSSSPKMVAGVLAGCLRWLADRYEPRSPIGKSLMVVTIPRSAVERMNATGETFLLSGPPTLETPTFAYLSSTGQTEYFGPHFVGGSNVLMDFSIRPLGHGGA